jgi:MFS family permease
MLAADAASGEREREILAGAGWRSWSALSVLVLITLFGYVDRQVFILLAEPIRIDLGLSDAELGMLQGLGIAFFAAVAGYPIGWLADRYDRRLVLAGCILAWSLAVIGCGLAFSFGPLFVASAVVGAGEAGLVPIVYALIPHYFEGARRATANAIYTVATQLGVGLASAACAALIVGVGASRSFLAPSLAHLHDWRLAFLGAAIPAPLMLLALATLPRGSSDQQKEGIAAPVEPPASSVIKHLSLYRRRVGGFFLGNSLATFGFASIINWVPVITMRLYHVTAAYAGAMTGTATLAATIVGFLLGVAMIRLLAPRYGPRFPLFAIWTACAGAALTTFVLLFATSAIEIFVLQGVQFALIMGAFMMFPTALQDLAPDQLRGRIIALSNVVRMVFLALSPLAVGALSDALPFHDRSILVSAVTLATLGLGLAAVAFWWAGGGEGPEVEQGAA